MRRELKFNSFEGALAELDQLEKGPVQTTGLWSFYQILIHCAESLEFCVRRYPSEAPWVIRATVGRLAFKELMKMGYFKPGMVNPRAPRKREEGDERSALVRLRKAILDFQVYTGPMATHPFFGKIARQDFEKYQLMHLAHHLGHAQLKA
jgi:Protein of unknown function (DUF1569)